MWFFGKKNTEEKNTEEKNTEEKNTEEQNNAEEPGKGFFARLKEGLTKTRDSFAKSLSNAFTASEIDDDFYEELEEILIMADIGVTATESIIDDLKARVKKDHLKKTEECRDILKESIKAQMKVEETEYRFESEKSIIMVIGVNGVGKTTTVGKLASKFKAQGKKVLIAAADTFRAAASEQLEVWADRAGVPIVGSTGGADPASVVFDAVSACKARGVDILLIDTAGRLHNKKNLMEELRKMDKIISREFPDAHRENLIVLDGTTGQNALIQAKEFSEVAPLTGIVLTKMDGTAKGGIAVAIQSELDIPVKYIGVGEHIDDLQKFDPDAFVEAIFN
ncbi:MAG: signal recognition particle-docking protein FtsY [Lachnospiraceae bacterium]|nr:signal recognition particle-docking protein FtsY [Lachnospiraceae bacterium]